VAEDLNTFLISAEGVVADAGHFSNAAETEHYHRLNAEGIKGEEVFKVLVNKLSLIRALAKELQNVYIANDREIPDHKVEEIQSTYNELITLEKLHLTNLPKWRQTRDAWGVWARTWTSCNSSHWSFFKYRRRRLFAK